MKQIAGEVIPPRARLAEGSKGAQDEPKILFAQRLVIEPQGRQEPRSQGFQNDIRSRRQTPEKLAAVGSIQIEGNASFGRIVVPEGQTALRVGDVVEEWPD